MIEHSGVEVTIPAGEDFPETPAYAMLPPDATRGMVVIHEMLGRRPDIDRVVHRFAASGYAAVEPDLFRAPSAFTCIRRTMQAMHTGKGPAVHQASAVRAWLCAQTGIEERRVGIIGFCFGGGFALAVGRGWGAVSTNYGMIPIRREALVGMGPTIGCYGGRDRPMRGSGARLEARLKAVGVEVETHTFAEAGHAFLTDGHHPVLSYLGRPFTHVEYRADIAEEAWRRIFAFFDRHLA